MYYIIYGIFYLVSLLPFFIIYLISDCIFFIVYYLIGYRKSEVIKNLYKAFPEKTDKEIKSISKNFYKNFVDTFIESIKLISLSKEGISKMIESDLSEAIKLSDKGKSIQFHAGHQFNWELVNLTLAEKLNIPFVVVYMKIHNKYLDKIYYDFRSKTGAIMVAVHEFRSKMHHLFKSQYAIGLAADQNPAPPHNAYWLNFFNTPAPFVTGPDKTARRYNASVFFLKIIKIKRGKYKMVIELLTEDGAALPEGKLTILYRDALENTIRKNPDNYLWSHRRWKHEYKSEYVKKWIDTTPAPTI
jgi:KDO2-lipid IV(A) lauroyltransferase